jgi:HlyD family secretion protein
MTSGFSGGWRRSAWLLLSFVITLTVAGWSLVGRIPTWGRPVGVDAFECVVVSRADLDTTILVGGDLQPAKQTTVRCQVEDITDSDGTMVLSVIKNGASVKKGDELCRLDSSAIEELARQEEIVVNQARALCVNAGLELETARISLREYEEGLVTQSTQEFEARIALGQSDTQRQVDRVAWAEDMVAKGYLARGQLLSERQTLARMRHDLRKTEGESRRLNSTSVSSRTD